MKETVLATFSNLSQAHNALQEMADKGYATSNLSLIMRHGDHIHLKSTETGKSALDFPVAYQKTGGGLTGVNGLLLNAGTLDLADVGEVLVAGEVGSFLTGVGANGLTGGLIQLGLPAHISQRLIKPLNDDKIIVALRVNPKDAERVADVFKSLGCEEVGIYGLE